MNKIIKFFFAVIVVNTSTLNAQNINEILGKAFKSVDSSEYYFQKAKKTIKNDKDQAQFYFCKGARFGDYNVLDSAIYYNSKAIQLFQKLDDSNSLLFLYNNNSRNYSKLGQYEKALENSFKGLAIAEKTKNEYWIYKNNVWLSIVYHDFENFEKGVEYGKKSFDLIKNKGENPLEIAEALNAIAINYDDWNKPNEALKYHKKVFEFVKGKDTLKIFNTYNNIGNTLLKQERYKEAENWILRAKKIDEVNENKNRNDINLYFKATYYTNLAVIASKLKQFDKAEKLFQKAKEYSIKSSDAEKLRDYYYQEYLFNKERNNLEKAIESQDSYLKLRDSVFNLNRDKVITEIETKYETAKNEKLLLEKEIETRQKSTTILILILIMIFIAFFSYLIFRQQRLKNKQQEQEFELKSAIAKIETQNSLHEQRLSISRDLHDNIGAQLTFVISSIDNLKLGKSITDKKINNQLNLISEFTKSTIVELRDTIWAMNSDELSFEDLRSRLFNFVEKAKHSTNNLNISYNIKESLLKKRIPSIYGITIYRVIQEAINNAIKHADASKIDVVIEQDGKELNISINDNGKGFNQNEVDFGNGLLNMQKRVEDIDGELTIETKLNFGTKISFSIFKDKLL